MRIIGIVRMKFCVFFLSLFLFFSCNKSKNDAKNNSNFLKNAEWFSDINNYKNQKKYQNKFISIYNECLKKEDYENAKLLLYKYGALVSNMYLHDSVSVTYTQKFLDHNFSVKKDTTFVLLYYVCANQLSYANKQKEAIQWAKKTLYHNALQNKKIDIRAKNLLGVCYNYTNEPKKAIEIFAKIITIAEQENDYKFLGSLNNNMAYAYDMLCAYNESEKMYKKAAYNFLKAKDTTSYFSLQTTFATNNFGQKKDTLQTVRFIDSLLKEFQNYSQPGELDHSNIYGVKSLRHFLLKQHDSALYYIDKSSNYYRKSNNSFYLMFNDMFADQIYFDKHKKLKNKQKTIAMAEEFLANESKFESQELYHLLYENAKIENNTTEALYYRDKEIELKDATLIQNQKGQLFEIDKKYQAEKKEKLLSQQQALIYKNKTLIIGLLFALSIVLLGTFLFYTRKRKQEIQAEAIRQEQFTFQLLQNTEEERSRIASELHDSVNHDLLNIKNSLINGKSIEVSDVASVIEEVRNISRNLHPAVLENIGLEASIENLCERLTEIGLFTTCEIEYNEELSKAKELQLYRIIQEALNNTLKHGKANAAKVILTTQNNSLHLEVKDNGNGFDVSQQLNNPKSFGLQSILQRAKTIAAKINIDSTNKGTVILLKIPV